MSFSELLLTRRVDSIRPSYPSPMGCDLCSAEFGEPSQLRDAVMGGCALNFIDLACHAYDIKQPNVAPRLPGSTVSTKHLDDESKTEILSSVCSILTFINLPCPSAAAAAS